MSATDTTADGAFSRRSFLKVSAAAGGGLLLGFDLNAFAQPAAGPVKPFVINPNAYIAIAPDGKVTLTIPQEEMGQGVYTSFSQLLADELDVSFDQVTAVPAPPDDFVYGFPKSHHHVTGGSNSVRQFYTAMRQVGAAGRAIMIAAAAQQWKVDPATLRTEDGQVIDDAHGGRKLSYGVLAPHAAKLPAPQKPQLKADKDLKIIGKPVHRLDGPAKGNGTAQYGIDVRLPDMKVAVISAAPVVGGKLAHVDDSGIKNMPDLQLVVLDDLVAVVGPNFWSARKGMGALKISWNDGPNGKGSSEQIWKELRDASAKKGVAGLNVGDADKALSQGTRLDVAYELPLLAHAPMEPICFTAHVTADGCELWGGTQAQTGVVTAAAKTLKMKPEKILFHNYMLGGAFGRRTETDFVEKTVRVAQKVDGPVKVMWTREEDMTHDMYRPAYRNVMSASLTADGKIAGWTHRVAGGSVQARLQRKAPPGGLDKGSLDGALDNIYGVGNYRVEYVWAEPKVLNVGFWRAVSPNNNVFAVESLMDELALKAGKDPVAFRLENLGTQPRLKAALKLAAEKASWGAKLGPRRGQGVCCQFAFGTYIATIADVEVDEDGAVKVHRFTSVVDAGRTINPDTIEAQIQGGLMFGTSAALFNDITVKNGRVQQSNFHDYRVLRMNEAPPVIDVHLIPSKQAPGGIGEPGVAASTPSLVNAIAAATGVRLRRMPIDRDLLAGRKSA